jgi:hypothetical protein
MRLITRIRIALFACGAAGVMLSLSLVIGSFLRHVDTTDYLKQANEGVPWVRWGLGSALIGFALCFLGRNWWRLAGLSLGLLLSVWWFLIAESLY